MDETDVALINAGVNAVGQGASIAAQANINRKTRKWNEQMYERQRADALANWNMNNEYNSPTAQMNRLKAAGLNPNLVYGHGAVGNASSPVQGVDVKSWSPQSPDYKGMGDRISSSMMNYYNVKNMQAQHDLLKSQNTVALQEAAVKAASAESLRLDNRRKEFDYGFESELRPYSADIRKETARKLMTESDVMLDRNEREAAMNSMSLKEAAEKILTMRADRARTSDERDRIKADIDRIRSSTRLQELDEGLKKNGIQPSDNLMFRVLGRILNTDRGQAALDMMVPDKSIAPKSNLERLLDSWFK